MIEHALNVEHLWLFSLRLSLGRYVPDANILFEPQCNIFISKLRTFEEAAGLLLVQGQQFASPLADARQRVLDAPHLALVAESIFTDQLQLLVQPLLLKGTPGGRVGLTTHQRNARHLDRLWAPGGGK